MGQQSRRVLIADGVITKSVHSEVLELLTADDENNAPSDSAGRFIDRPEGDDRTGFDGYDARALEDPRRDAVFVFDVN